MKKFILSLILALSLAPIYAQIEKGSTPTISLEMTDSAGAAITTAADINCLLSKAGGTQTAATNCTNGGTECIHNARGQYKFPLTAAETNTVGELWFDCEDTVASSLVWREKISVVDGIPANITEINGVAAAAVGLAGLADGIVVSTANGSMATTTVFDTALTNANADFFNDATLLFTAGALDGQARRITDYGNATVVAGSTVSGNLASSTTPSLASVVVGAGANRALSCSISGRNGTLTTVTSVDFNTTETMTLVKREAQAANLWTEIFVLYNPTVTTAAVDFVLDNADATAAACTPFTGVKQLTGTGTPLGAQGTTGTANSLALTDGSVDGLGYDSIAVENAATSLAIDSGQTQRSNLTDGASYDAGTSTDVGAATINIGWTWVTSLDFVHAAVAILPAKIITVDKAFSVAPSNTDPFVIIPHGFGALRPTTGDRTLDITAAGQGAIDLDNTVGTIAKTTDITGFTDLSAAQVNTEADTALSDVGVTSARQAKLDNLPSGVKKNTALSNFTFLMRDSTTDAPKTGLTVSATRRIDAGAFAATANSVTEVSGGYYTIDLAASDLNGDVITFRFTASGANDTGVTIKTNP